MTVVDEETGGSLGAQWITENHPDKVRCDLLVNEGGGAVFELRRQTLLRRLLRREGRLPLHRHRPPASPATPRCRAWAINALLKMGPLLDRFAARQPSYTATGEPAAFLSGIGEDPDDPHGALERLQRGEPAAGGSSSSR